MHVTSKRSDGYHNIQTIFQLVDYCDEININYRSDGLISRISGNENISKDQILDAVAILNRDFRLQNTDANNVQSTFSSMPSDIEVEFKLATKAPNGQCFSGITRTLNALTNDGSSGQAQVAAVTAGRG